jgi:hypothetical protein
MPERGRQLRRTYAVTLLACRPAPTEVQPASAPRLPQAEQMKRQRSSYPLYTSQAINAPTTTSARSQTIRNKIA